MKLFGWILAASYFAVLGSSPSSAAESAEPATAQQASAIATNLPGPRIQFATPIHDFGRVIAGELVKHVYYFTNTGDSLLVVSNVQTSCGCTTAGQWSREVEAGQTGTIPIQFQGASFGGAITKFITVFSNDKVQPSTQLQIKGIVWKPVEANPQYCVLNIPPDSRSGTNSVKIINHTDQPLVLSDPESNNRYFAADISTNQPGKEFVLTIRTVGTLPPGNSQAMISVKTSSTNAPVVSVTAMAYVQSAISVLPPQLGLPPAPLADKLTPSVSIVNNLTNKLSVLEPSINVTNVGVQLREVIPGKNYSIALDFPQGFEIYQGQVVVLTAKTDNPQYPLLKIPVYQMPKAAVTPSQPAVQPAAPRAPQSPPAATYVPMPRPDAAGTGPSSTAAPPPLPPGAALK